MERYKIVIIAGEAGSGKDTLAHALTHKLKSLSIPVHEVVTHTTRPKRDYEKDGVDNHFVEPNEMVDLILEGKMLEAVTFNGWAYGTCIDDLELNKINIETLNPEGIENMAIDRRIDMFIIQCECDEKTRLIRQLSREQDPDVDEVIRRLHADRIDFSEFEPRKCSPWFINVTTSNEVSVDDEINSVLAHFRAWVTKDNWHTRNSINIDALN